MPEKLILHSSRKAVHPPDTTMARIKRELLEFISTLPAYHNLKELPFKSGIYFVIDRREDEIIYIGKSGNIQFRWKGYSHPVLRSRLADEWIEIRWKPLDKDHFYNLKHEEATYIALLCPWYNQRISAALPKDYM